MPPVIMVQRAEFREPAQSTSVRQCFSAILRPVSEMLPVGVPTPYIFAEMIKTFRDRRLRELFVTGRSGKIDRRLQARLIRQLDALDSAQNPRQLDVPGWRFHGLRGYRGCFSLTVTGNWRLTFEWRDGHAWRVDLEDYH